MEYVADLSAWVGDLAEDEDLGERVMMALEGHPEVLGPAVSQNLALGILSATFNVEAPSADVAVRIARDAFREAMIGAGLEEARFTEMHVCEEREEAAATA